MWRGWLFLAAVLGLVGLVLLGQGLGIIPGSFMTGSPFWAVMGGFMLLVALLVGWWAYRAARRP